MDEKQFKTLMKKMDNIFVILATLAVKDLKTQADQAKYLSSMGFKPAEIAKMLGTTPGTIRSGLSKARKQAKKPVENAES